MPNGSLIVKYESSDTTGVTQDPPWIYLGLSEGRSGGTGVPAVGLVGRLVDTASSSGVGRLVDAASGSIDLNCWSLASHIH